MAVLPGEKTDPTSRAINKGLDGARENQEKTLPMSPEEKELRREKYKESKKNAKDCLRFPDELFPKKGIIAAFLKWVDPIIESPREYILLGALMLISALLQDRFFYKEGGGKVKLNLYLILIGMSRATRKSTIVNKVKKFIARHFEPFDNFIFPSRTTTEAFAALTAGKIEDIDNTDKTTKKFLSAQTKGVKFFSEFADLITHLQKSYAAGMKELITSAYDDCPPDYTLTRKDGKMKPQIDFLGIFAASTPEWITMNLAPGEMMSGFLARFLMVYAEPSNKRFPVRQQTDEKLELEIADAIKAVQDRGPAEMTFSENARVLYEGWYAQDKDREAEDTSPTAAAYSEHQSHVKKLAALFQLAEDGETLVSGANLALAADLIFHLRRQLDYLTRDKIFQRKESALVSQIRDIVGNGGEVSRTKLCDLLHNTSDRKERDAAIAELVEREIIEKRTIKTGGKPKIVYVLQSSS